MFGTCFWLRDDILGQDGFLWVIEIESGYLVSRLLTVVNDEEEEVSIEAS